MATLRLGDRGLAVRELQGLLLGRGLNVGVRDGVFGARTLLAVTEFQRTAGLVPDGLAGPVTMRALGAGGDGAVGGVPREADGAGAVVGGSRAVAGGVLRPLSFLSMQEMFGAFDWTPRPGMRPKQEVEILGGWEERNIVRVHVPLFEGVPWYEPGGSERCSGLVRVHRLAVGPLRGACAEIVEAGLAGRIVTVDGFFFARYQAGSATSLSRHSWGTAFDVNAYANGYGLRPAAAGAAGSVRELVGILARWGWAWGGDWAKPDGMHFELTRLDARAVRAGDDGVQRDADRGPTGGDSTDGDRKDE